MQTYTAVGAAPTKAREIYRHRVAIIGGGTAGITVAAQLARRGIHDVALIEPSSKHYYQPLWTLVGAGVAKAEQSVRDEARFIPKGVRWIQDYAVEIDPEQQLICTRDGTRVQYDFLVVAPGVESDWDKIQGARETLGQNGVRPTMATTSRPRHGSSSSRRARASRCLPCPTPPSQATPSSAAARRRKSPTWQRTTSAPTTAP